MTGSLPAPYDAGAPARGAQSPRSRGVALALAIAGGFCGLHRFYVGRPGTGVLMVVTLGGLGFWWLYDIVLVAAGELRDGRGRRVARWEAGDEPRSAPDDPVAFQVQDLAGEVDVLRAEVSELAERLDFAERMLAQQREQRGLQP